MIRAQLLRIDRGLAVSQVADKTGIDQRTIHKIERTEKGSTWDVMQKLAEFYGVLPQDLLTPVGPVEEAA